MSLPGSSVSKKKIAPPIIGGQHFAGFDAPVRCVWCEISSKIRLRRRELLREFRILPTSVAQRPRKIRKDQPLEIGVILTVVEKLCPHHAWLIARDPRSLVLDSSDAPEHGKGRALDRNIVRLESRILLGEPEPSVGRIAGSLTQTLNEHSPTGHPISRFAARS